ncbi:hypothetical protein Tco_1361771 [Tanacetum coccineum]
MPSYILERAQKGALHSPKGMREGKMFRLIKWDCKDEVDHLLEQEESASSIRENSLSRIGVKIWIECDGFLANLMGNSPSKISINACLQFQKPRPRINGFDLWFWHVSSTPASMAVTYLSKSVLTHVFVSGSRSEREDNSGW